MGQRGDVRLSYWSFTNYRTCPQKWAFQYIRKPFRPVRDNFWAVSGSTVHSLWEDFTGGVKSGQLQWDDKSFLTDNVVGYYDKFVGENPVDWAGNGTTLPKHRDTALPEIESSLTWLYEELEREGLIPCDPGTIHTEFSFKTPFNEQVTMTGRTDLVFEHSNSLTVVDLKDVWKRSNVDWRQLLWYTLGLEPQFNKPVTRAGFCLTKLRSWSWRDPDAKDYRTTLSREILETALQILRDPFKAVINRHNCTYCDVNKRCPEWQRYSASSRAILETIAQLEEGKVDI